MQMKRKVEYLFGFRRWILTFYYKTDWMDIFLINFLQTNTREYKLGKGFKSSLRQIEREDRIRFEYKPSKSSNIYQLLIL